MLASLKLWLEHGIEGEPCTQVPRRDLRRPLTPQDIGEDWGTPMVPTYKPPFTFTGELKKVTVQAK